MGFSAGVSSLFVFFPSFSSADESSADEVGVPLRLCKTDRIRPRRRRRRSFGVPRRRKTVRIRGRSPFTSKDEGDGFGVGDSERENIEEVRDLAKEEAYFQSSKINKKFEGRQNHKVVVWVKSTL